MVLMPVSGSPAKSVQRSQHAILTLEHENGVQTQYAHLSEFLVNAGAEVRQGQIIAKTGDSGWTTGPHLHLGVLIDGEAVDPLEALKSES